MRLSALFSAALAALFPSASLPAPILLRARPDDRRRRPSGRPAALPALLVLAGMLAASPTPATAQTTAVDVELVLAVDISYSMDEEEQRLQRAGYIDAITSPEVMRAIGQGRHKRIAVAYVEWAGSPEQRTIVDWTLIDGPETAQNFANKLIEQPIRRAYRTSISAAVAYSAAMFDRNAFDGIRQVIDVSGDGVNNQGPLVETIRDEVVGRGIVINGLPIMIKRQSLGYRDFDALDRYYEECVIGGEGSFVVPIKSPDQFSSATRMKLIMEIADLGPRDAMRVVPVSMRANPMCTVGETMWRDRIDWMRN